MGKNRKARSVEQIIGILRDAEIKLSSGMTVSRICRDLGISDATYYKWRKQYGGMDVNHAKALKALSDENARLKVFMNKAKGLYNVSERRLCTIFRTHRSMVRYVHKDVCDDVRLISDMHRLAQKYPRYGYRCVCALLKGAGWRVNHKRIEQLGKRRVYKCHRK